MEALGQQRADLQTREASRVVRLRTDRDTVGAGFKPARRQQETDREVTHRPGYRIRAGKRAVLWQRGYCEHVFRTEKARSRLHRA